MGSNRISTSKTLGELAKELHRRAKSRESVEEQAADRLEAIERAWREYWSEIDNPSRDYIMVRQTRAKLRTAIEGKEP